MYADSEQGAHYGNQRLLLPRYLACVTLHSVIFLSLYILMYCVLLKFYEMGIDNLKRHFHSELQA